MELVSNQYVAVQCTPASQSRRDCRANCTLERSVRALPPPPPPRGRRHGPRPSPMTSCAISLLLYSERAESPRPRQQRTAQQHRLRPSDWRGDGDWTGTGDGRGGDAAGADSTADTQAGRARRGGARSPPPPSVPPPLPSPRSVSLSSALLSRSRGTQLSTAVEGFQPEGQKGKRSAREGGKGRSDHSSSRCGLERNGGRGRTGR